MSLYRGNRRITRPIVNGKPARMLLYQGRQVWPCRGPLVLPPIMKRMTADATGMWFEAGFRSPEILAGNATTGWTDPRGYCAMKLERTPDMEHWTQGGWSDCADCGTETEPGIWEYWARYEVPRFWQTVLIDLAATSDRYAKSITGIYLYGVPVPLPRYPYAMPADAAALQADLRTAGYTGATVAYTPGSLIAKATNHTVDWTKRITLTHAGPSVTAATAVGGSFIPLPHASYALPGAAAGLQQDLRNAGHSGAVVTLHGGTWELRLPDRPAVGNQREFSLTITPGDPYPVWDFFGNYQGLAPADGVMGTPGNVRTPAGAPLAEALTQFARLRILPGSRTLP